MWYEHVKRRKILKQLSNKVKVCYNLLTFYSPTMSSIEQKQEVLKWLEGLFEGETIPQIDTTDELRIKNLYELQQQCNETLRDVNILTDFKKLQTLEYQKETERMSKVINDAGIFLETKSSLEDDQLEKLVNVLGDAADLLGVDNPTEDDLDIALANLRLKASDTHVFELTKQQKAEKEKIEMLENNSKLSYTENALAYENKEAKHRLLTINNLRKKTGFMMEKLKEYSKSVEASKYNSKKNGLRKEILHENILKLKKELDDIEEDDLKPKQLKLMGYNGLPPSLELAKAKVAEAENQLDELVRELTKEISALHV